MKVSIIIPSYNEDKTLLRVVKKVLTHVPDYKEIIIIDDGSTDKTSQIFKKLRNQKDIKLIVNKKNLGKGASIVKALKIAKGDIIVIQDADLEYDPRQIPNLIAPFRNKKIMVVYGSRVLRNNPKSHWTFNLGGRLVTFATNILYATNITDEPTGYKAFRYEIIKKIKPNSKGFEFCPEVTAKIAKKGFKIYEIPISYNPRPVSEKKIKWHDGIAAIFYLFKYRFFD